MARQYLVAAIRHQSEDGVLVSREEVLQQLTKAKDSPETKEGDLLCEELEKVVIDTDMDKYFQVRTQLPSQEKEELLGFLRKNIDVFAWSAYNVPSVDPNFICHYLNVNLTAVPKK